MTREQKRHFIEALYGLDKIRNMLELHGFDIHLDEEEIDETLRRNDAQRLEIAADAYLLMEKQILRAVDHARAHLVLLREEMCGND